MSFQNIRSKEFLQQVQYQTSNNLNARILLHKLYTPPGQNIWDFLEDRYCFKSHDRILEVGCGTGEFWLHLPKELTSNLNLFLTDFSEGMLEKTRKNFLEAGINSQFQVADVEKLPFQTSSFDVILAQFMLYHARDKQKALTEIARVLKPSGWAGIVLNKRDGLTRFSSLAKKIDSSLELELNAAQLFSSEDAEDMFESVFEKVSKFDYELEMRVDDPKIIVDYAKSSSPFIKANPTEKFWDKYVDAIVTEIEEIGYFSIKKASVLFKVKTI
jgi:ubiquinone/menaquinone biosynthesis C-methylase UbiE